MANFTDFDALGMERSVALAFLKDPAACDLADVLVLPGSKQTIDDLEWLRARGFAERLAAFTGLLIGICGGFQMLGISIDDPAGVESEGMPRAAAGLGVLAVRTIMNREKTVRRASGVARCGGAAFTGYEIHMGETEYLFEAEPFAEILREGEDLPRTDGAIASSRNAWGTYIHGVFDDDAFRHSFLNSARAAAGLPPVANHLRSKAERQARIDRWADHLRQSLDLNLIRSWAT
jgi:adenosylcobyric acid synthase